MAETRKAPKDKSIRMSSVPEAKRREKIHESSKLSSDSHTLWHEDIIHTARYK